MILEVDLSYPKDLHDFHSDFLLTSENKTGDEKSPKLLLNPYNKEKRAIHYTTLKQCINKGLKF